MSYCWTCVYGRVCLFRDCLFLIGILCNYLMVFIYKCQPTLIKLIKLFGRVRKDKEYFFFCCINFFPQNDYIT
uniref:Uncharacterized protein n=1 Tax=Lepeophtheirus salmonis TaxID=72036 RepID=A0A0K2UUA9_LEPSM